MSWRTFSIGLAIVVAAFIALFVGIQAAGAGTHRPEGTAERWLAAISDTTRKGVRSDALKRAAGERSKGAPANLGLDLTSSDAKKDGKRSFRDLEVGKATVVGPQATVPFLLHQYASSGPTLKRDGDVVLLREGDRWRVSSVYGPRRPGERVPSEGGAPPSSAPKSYWVVALLLGLVVTAVCSGLINLAGRAARTAPATA